MRIQRLNHAAHCHRRRRSSSSTWPEPARNVGLQQRRHSDQCPAETASHRRRGRQGSPTSSPRCELTAALQYANQEMQYAELKPKRRKRINKVSQRSPPRPLFTVQNVTTHRSTATSHGMLFTLIRCDAVLVCVPVKGLILFFIYVYQVEVARQLWLITVKLLDFMTWLTEPYMHISSSLSSSSLSYYNHSRNRSGGKGILIKTVSVLQYCVPL